MKNPVKKPVKKSTKKEWRLSDFSDALAKASDRKRKEDDDYAKRFKQELPAKIKQLKKASNDDLFTLYDNALQGGYSSAVIMNVLVEYKEAIKGEMLRRMK